MKNTPQRISKRLDSTEEQISDLEDRVMGSTKLNQRKEKE